MTREIELTQGKFALVDDDDFERLSKYKWQALKHGAKWYAVRDRCKVLMHRDVINTPKGMDTDHINNDGLDNRKSNLRICTRTQNQYNRGKHLRSTSGYKGVSWDKCNKKWKAQIRHDSVYVAIGYFSSPIDAARAYDDAAVRYHGEFANLNKV